MLSPKVIDKSKDDNTVWEAEPLERLAREGQLAAYPHHGFWHPMDTLRDKNQLEACGVRAMRPGSLELNPEFWREKRVLLTGHTGFKGSWLASVAAVPGRGYCRLLACASDRSQPLCSGEVGQKGMRSVCGDIHDLQHLIFVSFAESRPEFVFHLAAQSLVRRSYARRSR